MFNAVASPLRVHGDSSRDGSKRSLESLQNQNQRFALKGREAKDDLAVLTLLIAFGSRIWCWSSGCLIGVEILH